MEKVKVELGDRSYDITINNGLLDNAGKYMSQLGFKDRCVVVTNPTVGKLYLERLLTSLKKESFEISVCEVPDGEEFKTLEIAQTIFDKLISERVERSTPIIALGGGVIGDMTGFVAATYLRGIPYIQIPTTLLSQVDSSVGGKTAVNHPKGKNLIGAFYQPKAVLIDPEVLKTLDDRNFKSGLAEVLKYGIIYDESFFDFLISNSEQIYSHGDALIKAIKRSCEIKAEVVKEDEKESGLRAILNLGHTFGHAIEALTGYKSVSHGEAVSQGTVLAVQFSLFLGETTVPTVDKIIDGIDILNLSKNVPQGLKVGQMIDVMKVDKKVKGGKVYFIIPESVGIVKIMDVEINKIERFLTENGQFC